MRRTGLSAVILATLVVGTLVGALIAAGLNPAPDTSAISNSTRAPMVTAKIEQRPVRTRATLSGALQQARLTVVNPMVGTPAGTPTETEDNAGGKSGSSTIPQAVLQVVSRRLHSKGDRVSPGSLLAEVSGRPVYAFPSSAPLYRDLTIGSVGNDMRALQRLLARKGYFRASPDGRFRKGTLAALQRLFAHDGYRLSEVAPGRKGLALAETARLPGKNLRVATVCPVGLEPTTRRPMLRVETRPAVVTARADLLQADAFSTGKAVSVQIGSADSLASTVVAVSAFQDAGASTPAGYDITVAVPGEIDVEQMASQPILVSESGKIAQAPAVPLAALREGLDGARHVLVPTGGETGQVRPEEVPVTVIAQVSGYAILEKTDRLPVGTAVVVSGG